MRELNRRHFGAVVGVGALGATDAHGRRHHKRPPAPILTRSGARLLVHGKPSRLSGVNAYWVGLDDNIRDGAGDPVLPSHDTLTAAFAGMRNMGCSVVRAHTVGISAGTAKSFETAPGRFADANLDSADWAVYQAKRRQILLMVPITDQWNYYHGGKGVFVHWAYQQNPSGLTDVPAPSHLFDADGAEKGSKIEDQFYADDAGGLRIRALFKHYVSHWLNHVNPYTGLAYKDDPTIAIIETGNEIYSATAEWTEDLAAHIKRIAPRKLVADGSAATGLAVSAAPGLHAAHVDILGSHYYAQDSSYQPAPIMTLAGQLDADVAAAQRAGKVFVMGEYPWTRPDIAQWWAKVERKAAVAADMMWAFIGDDETHGGAFGSDDYPVHWPYSGPTEQRYAPALARHISAVSGVPLACGAGTDPPSGKTNLVRSAPAANAADAGLFSAGDNTSLATDSDTAESGGSSVRITSTAADNYPYVYPSAPASGAAVAAGATYTGIVSVRPDAARGYSAQISWYDASGGYLSKLVGIQVTCAAAEWTQLLVSGTAPAGATQAIVQSNAGDAQAAGAVTHMDQLGIFTGFGIPTWVSP